MGTLCRNASRTCCLRRLCCKRWWKRNAAETATGAGAETEAPAIDKSLIARNGINVCIASEPDNIDPALNSTVDGATLILHAFSGLARWEQKEDGSFNIAPDCAEELVEGRAKTALSPIPIRCATASSGPTDSLSLQGTLSFPGRERQTPRQLPIMGICLTRSPAMTK